MAVSNIYICSSLCPSVGRYQQSIRPQRDQDGQPANRLHHQSHRYQSGHRNMHTTAYQARMALPHARVLQRTQASHVEWVHYTIRFLCHRYANLYYTILLRTTRRVGVLKLLYFHYHSLHLLVASLFVRRASLCKHGVFSPRRCIPFTSVFEDESLR